MGGIRVAVIGAGAAGLCAARHVLSRPEIFDPPVVYELTGHVGGTWFYEEQVGTHSNGCPIHSSMYKNLRTNLPKEVMMFPDFPFDDHLPSFLHHTSVLQYLEKYCEGYDITSHIRFNTVVEKVKPVSMATETGGAVTWEVISRDTRGDRNAQTFDSVFVCSGHYSDPHLPYIPGIEHFKGEVFHSHSYRYPEPFANKSVVVLGGGASGVDIAVELVQVNARVTLSHNKPPLLLPLGIRQTPPAVGISEDGSLHFHDGSVTQADVLLLCTGYNFNFPFLCPSELGLEIQEHIVTPLYKFLLPPAFSSIFFIGICKHICPFVHFHCQVQFALAVLQGSVKLPTQEKMEKETQREMQRKQEMGVQMKHLLHMDSEQWGYYLELARTGQFSPPQPVIQSLYEEVGRQRRKHPQTYKQINYRLIDATQWVIMERPAGQADEV